MNTEALQKCYNHEVCDNYFDPTPKGFVPIKDGNAIPWEVCAKCYNTFFPSSKLEFRDANTRCDGCTWELERQVSFPDLSCKHWFCIYCAKKLYQERNGNKPCDECFWECFAGARKLNAEGGV